jgi:hypothetical protein
VAVPFIFGIPPLPFPPWSHEFAVAPTTKPPEISQSHTAKMVNLMGAQFPSNLLLEPAGLTVEYERYMGILEEAKTTLDDQEKSRNKDLGLIELAEYNRDMAALSAEWCKTKRKLLDERDADNKKFLQGQLKDLEKQALELKKGNAKAGGPKDGQS